VRIGRGLGATLIAVHSAGRVVVSPPWDAEVAGGATVHCLGRERFGPAERARPGGRRPGRLTPRAIADTHA
jgi:hypothetical protein